MSKTEERYAAALEARAAAKEIAEFHFEHVKLRLADNTFYTPDFMVIHNDQTMEFIEVKGSWNAPNQDKSRVKLKVAAETHQWARFSAVVPIAQKNGGGWDVEQIGPHKERA
ncbi:DUF1064 domain-containing protein [Planctomyces sp. SH-PL14]|uniref:DUF1064 domain-containing protein n=1 Tax=Planctomyces sp. SH-PL14 TaxID=1632864 RepID=UPI0018D32285|nr:DUF1064 domain-containing protein [Planctomyces sp. SH-PL14]